MAQSGPKPSESRPSVIEWSLLHALSNAARSQGLHYSQPWPLKFHQACREQLPFGKAASPAATANAMARLEARGLVERREPTEEERNALAALLPLELREGSWYALTDAGCYTTLSDQERREARDA